MKNQTLVALAAIMIALLAGSGCASKIYVTDAPPPPPIPAGASDRDVKIYEAFYEAKIKSGLRCENREDYDKVQVQPAGVLNHSWQAHVVIEIQNPEPVPVNINTGAFEVVKNMCPGGKINLGRRININTGTGNYLRVSWSADGTKDGVKAYDESGSVTLYTGNTYRKRQEVRWTINLKKEKR